MINLAHFKGHAMGGFGGVLKNASIGVASRNGKTYIHTAGKAEDYNQLWQNLPEGWMESPENNTPFIESMSAAAQAVHEYFKGRSGIVYIDVMNNISMVGNDLAFDPGLGSCGKRGQMVRVGIGIPTLKIDSITVGGTKS